MGGGTGRHSEQAAERLQYEASIKAAAERLLREAEEKARIQQAAFEAQVAAERDAERAAGSLR